MASITIDCINGATTGLGSQSIGTPRSFPAAGAWSDIGLDGYSTLYIECILLYSSGSYHGAYSEGAFSVSTSDPVKRWAFTFQTAPEGNAVLGVILSTSAGGASEAGAGPDPVTVASTGYQLGICS